MAQAGDKVADAAHEQQRWMASAETCPPANPLNSAHQPLWGTDQFRFLVMHYPRPDPRCGSTSSCAPCAGKARLLWESERVGLRCDACCTVGLWWVVGCARLNQLLRNAAVPVSSHKSAKLSSCTLPWLADMSGDFLATPEHACSCKGMPIPVCSWRLS